MRKIFNAILTLVLLFSCYQSIAQSSSPILITEINYNSDSTMNPGNWVELYNKSASTVDISNWQIKNALTISYTIPSGTQLNASAYLVVFQDQLKFNAIFPGVTNKIGPSNLDFSNTADNVQLFDGSNNLMINVMYKDTGSWPRGADGWGRTLTLSDYNGNVNDGHNWFDGCMFGSPGVAYSPCNPDIVFSEINYSSSLLMDAGDWVELYNTTSSPISLNNYTFKDSRDTNIFFIPNGVTLPANGYRVLCQDVTKFLTRHPAVTNVNGPLLFGFKNKGEALRLFGANGKLLYSVLYDNKTPWPVTPDSGGYTLELLDVHGKMDEASNWFAGCPEGSPGMVYDPFCLNGVSEVYSSGFNFSVTTVTEQTISITVTGTNKNSNSMISIFDISGKEMFRTPAGNGPNEINTVTLSSGMYFVQLIAEGKSKTKKFIKQ